MKEHQSTTLPCGLRAIFEPSGGDVVYLGFTVAAGTRDEDGPDQGLAHLCEHMSFKGTARRRAWQVSSELERVGGDLNAYTTKEETVFYAAVLRPYVPRAIDLLCDIVFHSVSPERELRKEVDVVCDEIQSYEDSPADLIFDEFEETLFGGHPLGRSILGTREKLRTYTPADVLRFYRSRYTARSASFFALGGDYRQMLRCLQRATASLPQGDYSPQVAALPPYRPTVRRVPKAIHQAHVCMGARTFGQDDPRRTGLFLLNNLLGGPGMNNRLNQSLRERSGLVYSVESFTTAYRETGEWAISFACDPEDVERCRRLAVRELQRLIDRPLGAGQLRAAKKQLRGQLGLASDNRENYALAMGRVFARRGTHRDVERLLAQIDDLTASHLQQLAAEVFNPERLTTLIYHPA